MEDHISAENAISSPPRTHHKMPRSSSLSQLTEVAATRALEEERMADQQARARHLETKEHFSDVQENTNIPPSLPVGDQTESPRRNWQLRLRRVASRQGEQLGVECSPEKPADVSVSSFTEDFNVSPLSEEYRDESCQSDWYRKFSEDSNMGESVAYNALHNAFRNSKLGNGTERRVGHNYHALRRNTASLSSLKDAATVNEERDESIVSRQRRLALHRAKALRRTHSFSHRVDLSELEGGLPGWKSSPKDTDSVSFDSLANSVLHRQVRQNQSSTQNLYVEFEKALAEEVRNVLQRAAASERTERTETMEELFFNVASPIEPQVADYLRAAGGPMNIPRYYYQLLAQYFASEVKESSAYFTELQSTMNALYSHPIFPAIYCLLFHLWLLGTYEDVKFNESASSRLVLLTTGANRLFWADLQHYRHDFKPIFGFLAQVILHPSRLAEVPHRLYIELVIVVMKFLLFYDNQSHTAENLYFFFRQLPARAIPEKGQGLDNDWARSPEAESMTKETTSHDDDMNDSRCQETSHKTLAGHSRQEEEESDVNTPRQSGNSKNPWGYTTFLVSMSDHFSHSEYSKDMISKVSCFVHETSELLRMVQHENALLRILRGLRCLADPRLAAFLDGRTAAKLQDEIYAFTSPGGPTFPTRAVRRTALETLDTVFPRGSGIRRAVSVLFRLVHPYYWPGSFAHWIVGRAEVVLHKIPCMDRCFGQRKAAALVSLAEEQPKPHSSFIQSLLDSCGRLPVCGTLIVNVLQRIGMNGATSHVTETAAEGESPKAAASSSSQEVEIGNTSPNSKVAELLTNVCRSLPFSDKIMDIIGGGET
eukprot:gb/GECG01009608.1/.p1 GENE.gb/GECG01009608.1/~~gb/GECG01009608.1/.p1  ORF type:complete len:826 (+),score=74.25 gb/GECG01009608.1/:1-2478(+)